MTGEQYTHALLLFCPNCGRWVTFTMRPGHEASTLQCSCGAVHRFDPGRGWPRRRSGGAGLRRRCLRAPSRRAAWQPGVRPAGAGGG
jgi:hypothetical protein